MKIAILGGTFNPPHYGHLFFANEVRHNLGYDKIIFVPSSLSAHKSNDLNVTSEDRLNMLNLALADVDWAEVSDCDIRRGGITRTIDTLNDIETLYNPDSKLGFIIGDDLAGGFKHWKSPDLISSKADIIIGCRSYAEIEFEYPHTKVKNRRFPLSSSEIRERVKYNRDIHFLLPIEVINYIESNGLYKDNR